MTKTSYILIDYENVHPKNLDAVPLIGWNVVIFAGPGQPITSIPSELREAVKKLGPDSGIVKAPLKRKNALDFHIAYYIGVISICDPDGRIHILTKDKGLDSLLLHLKKKGISAKRWKSIFDIFPVASKAKAGTPPLPPDQLIHEAVNFLTAYKDKQAKKQTGLENNLKTHFRLTPDQAEELVLELQKQRFISLLENDRVEYHFPKNLLAAA